MTGKENNHHTISTHSWRNSCRCQKQAQLTILLMYSSRRAHLIEQLAFACQHEGNLICASVTMHSFVQDVRVQVQEQDVFKDICMPLPTSIVP